MIQINSNMSSTFPSWVDSSEKQKLYGEAAAFNASLIVLSSEHACQGFVNTKKLIQQGKLLRFSMSSMAESYTAYNEGFALCMSVKLMNLTVQGA